MKSWNIKVSWGTNIPSNRFYWVLVRSEWQLVVGAVKLESPGRIHNGASSPIPAAGHNLVGNVTGCSLVEQCRFQTCESRELGLPLPSLVFSLFSHMRYIMGWLALLSLSGLHKWPCFLVFKRQASPPGRSSPSVRWLESRAKCQEWSAAALCPQYPMHCQGLGSNWCAWCAR